MTLPTWSFPPIVRTALLMAVALFSARPALAADLHIKLPKHTSPTPVQRLNQEGVRALEHNNLARARRDFYRAYLLDPDDPFTLNNVAYLAELDGDLERAQRFYQLAADSGSEASVALATAPELEGHKLAEATSGRGGTAAEVNRLNVSAIALLRRERLPEAEQSLRRALALEPENPFTLNNLGFTLEKQGELQQAHECYARAAQAQSDEKIVLSFQRSWRGHPISEIAALNARATQQEITGHSSLDARVARLNLQGVSALNHNQPERARQRFLAAYQLDPSNAFAINNMGYISEVEGDRESAAYYYARAREAQRSGERIALATRKSLEGQRLASAASQSQEGVEEAEATQLAALRASGARPLPLRTRTQSAVLEPATPPRPEPEVPVRIVAEDNPPPERAPQAMAQRSSPAAKATPRPAPSSVPAPAARQPQPEDDQPLLPVIPDGPAPER